MGLTNLFEYTWGFDPADPADANRDTDTDGLPDHWEITYFSHATSASATENPDNDDLTNVQEFQNTTEPNDWDTDGDLLPDGWEVEFNLDPRDATGNNGANGDPDDDGLNNLQEGINGSNPGLEDSDGDGTNDGPEVGQGSNPNDPSDGGQAPPPEEIVEVPFSVGDPSGSHSERWKLNIVANGPDDTRQFGFVSPNFGEMGTQNFKLRLGNTYTISITHIATNIEEGGPDYDWEARIDGKPNGDGDDEANHFFMVGQAWLVDNRQGLLTTEKHGDDTNIAASRQAKLLPIKFSVESYSATITPPDPDVTSVALSGGGASLLIAKGDDPTFEIKATVKAIVSGVANNIPSVNAAISKWKLKIRQDVVAYGGSSIEYPNLHVNVTGSPVPGTDLPQGGFPERAFVGSNDIQEVEYSDSPAQTYKSAWQINPPDEEGIIQLPTPGIGPLQKATNDVTFITWVYVEHEDTEEKIYLKWVKWKTKWVINFDIEFSNGQTNVDIDSKPTWQFEKIEEGDAPAPQDPAEQPFVPQETLVPQ